MQRDLAGGKHGQMRARLSVFFFIHRVSDQTVHAAADKEDGKYYK